MTYGYLGSMRTVPGRRDDVVAILLRDVAALREAGCSRYIVMTSDDEPDRIWASEVWESKEHHDRSLQLPTAKAAIAEAMPLLLPESFTGQELTVAGGLV